MSDLVERYFAARDRLLSGPEDESEDAWCEMEDLWEVMSAAELDKVRQRYWQIIQARAYGKSEGA